MKLKTIQDFFEHAGGSNQVAAKLNVHQITALSWRRVGIPLKYWNRIMQEYKLTADDLYRISENARVQRD